MKPVETFQDHYYQLKSAAMRNSMNIALWKKMSTSYDQIEKHEKMVMRLEGVQGQRSAYKKNRLQIADIIH